MQPSIEIQLDRMSKVPFYLQIVQQIRAQILSSDLSEGDLLPSIRKLAKDLQISVITTKRAYEELEREGFINTVGGKGTFVAAHALSSILITSPLGSFGANHVDFGGIVCPVSATAITSATSTG